jgi:hypothetical protein
MPLCCNCSCKPAACLAAPDRLVTARARHHVYVVGLHGDIWYEPSFVQANPQALRHGPAVYVGMTGLTPALRFARHKAGVKANRWVLKYGIALLPDLYEVFNPMPYAVAAEMEIDLAWEFRERGWGVWQN